MGSDLRGLLRSNITTGKVCIFLKSFITLMELGVGCVGLLWYAHTMIFEQDERGFVGGGQ